MADDDISTFEKNIPILVEEKDKNSVFYLRQSTAARKNRNRYTW